MVVHDQQGLSEVMSDGDVMMVEHDVTAML